MLYSVHLNWVVSDISEIQNGSLIELSIDLSSVDKEDHHNDNDNDNNENHDEDDHNMLEIKIDSFNENKRNLDKSKRLTQYKNCIIDLKLNPTVRTTCSKVRPKLITESLLREKPREYCRDFS